MEVILIYTSIEFFQNTKTLGVILLEL